MSRRSPRIPITFEWLLRIGDRDGWTCHWCEGGYRPLDPWEVDHKKSIKHGGTNHLSNLALCHRSCNRDKGAVSVSA